MNVMASGDGNFAYDQYRFLDATTGTPIPLSNRDNAIGVTYLPFDFQLFDKVYPVGTKVLVCTNGWLSFDENAIAEYQNAALPASHVTHADGSTGTIPPAMIAPFFSDLYVRTGLFGSNGREICVKTFGTAPNRQWVIEWANMGMYESGVDLGVRISFEVILYERSNDIQFVYAVVSGAYADGSRTTVGFQSADYSRAVQTGYQQSILTEGTSLSYHFNKGDYIFSKISKKLGYEIYPDGSFTTKTESSFSDLTLGYATVISSTETTVPSGLAIITVKNDDGIVVSEASVPITTPLTTGRIYAEVDGNVNTGLAITNWNDEYAYIDFTLTDESGSDFRTGTLSIPANSQIAGFIDQEPYLCGKNFRGTITLESGDVGVSIVALRGLLNERGEFLITTLPVVDLDNVVANYSIILPHFAIGGGWSTQVILVNPLDEEIDGVIQFVDTQGNLIQVTGNGETKGDFPYKIAANSSFKLNATSAGKDSTTGWAVVTPTSGDNAPTPQAIFSYRSNGVTVTEAGVTTIRGTTFRSFVEFSGNPGAVGSIQSGLAICNTTEEEIEVDFELYDMGGTSYGYAHLRIPGQGQVSKFIPEIFSGVTLPSTFQGVVQITSSYEGAEIGVVGLRCRTNERNDYIITTTMPIDDANTTGQSKMSFPYIVNGGGYSTQFFLYGGFEEEIVGGTLYFHKQDGTTLHLPF